MPGTYSRYTSPLPLPDDAPGKKAIKRGSLQYWKAQIQAAGDKVQDLKDKEWDRNIQSYRAKVLHTAPMAGTSGEAVVPRDFPFVEQKISQLFFQTPDIHLTARQEGLKNAVQIFQPVINYYLSEDEVDALAVMNEVAFDALCPAGIMVSKIGYENFQSSPQSLETGSLVPGPESETLQQPGSILGLGPESQSPAPPGLVPEMGMVPNIVYERYFWERISPACYLCPTDFSSSVYDKAPWQGFRFEDDWQVLRSRYQLPEDMDPPGKGKDETDLKLKSESRDQTRVVQGRVTGAEIWYRTSLFDPQEPHPLKLRQLILIDGMDQPLVHRDSPYQKMVNGQLMGMIGFPIHVGALRYVSDTAFPPSEVSIAASTNQELNKGRTQMLQQRDRSMPMRIASLSRMGGEAGLEKLRANINQGIIPLADFDAQNPPVVAVGLASYPRENFAFNDYLDADLGQIWAMGQNQRAQESNTDLTATEVSKIDEWATTRLDKERRKMLTYFIGGVRKLASLIQLFASEPQLIQIIGPDKQPTLVQWNRDTIQGKFAFAARPDSSIRIDQTQAQQRILKLYELLGKDPNVRRTELLDEVCRQWNLDPNKIIIPQLPPQGPDPASLSMRLDPMALSIQNPNFPLYYAMLKEAGYTSLDKPDPALGGKTPIQAALEWAQFQQSVMDMGMGGQGPGAGMQPPSVGTGQPNGQSPAQGEHPGAMPHMDHISKHHADQTGDRSGPKVQ